MGLVKGITYYFGPPLQKGIEPARGIQLNDDGGLCRAFRKAILDGQLEFRMEIALAQLRPLTCHWGRCGQTAGLAACPPMRKDIGILVVIDQSIMPERKVACLNQTNRQRMVPHDLLEVFRKRATVSLGIREGVTHRTESLRENLPVTAVTGRFAWPSQVAA